MIFQFVHLSMIHGVTILLICAATYSIFAIVTFIIRYITITENTITPEDNKNTISKDIP